MYHYKNNNKKGFSLIELLVGMTIIITATTIILTIIVTSFRISSKAAVVDNARQNGNYAMNRMIRMIQFADSYNGRSTATGGSNGVRAGENGGPGWQTNCAGDTNTAININYEGEEKIIQCRNHNQIFIVDPDATPANEELVSSTKISVASCNIKCTKATATASPVISIWFDLAIGGSGVAVEKKTKIPFFTSVKMRNQ